MTFLTRFDRFDPFEELAADVVETKDAIIIKAEVAGLTEKDVTVEIENNILSLRGERKMEKETEEKGYRRIERSYANFSRSFTLPQNVDTTKINAIFNNGLLEVSIPKMETAKPRTINVEVKKKLTAAA